MCNLYKCFWSLCMAVLLIGLQIDSAHADSPPNIAQDIAWFGDPDSAGLPQAYDTIEDIEAAFNNGRREEERQLNLPAGTLGTIDLPEQALWDALTMQQKALILINAERTARRDMLPGILGLPLAGIESNLDTLAQQYAQILVNDNAFGHNQPWPGAPQVDTPFERIDNTPVVSDCHKDITYAENLAAFWTTETSIPLPVERAIYLWIYADAGSNWGHREALFLQDADLGFNGESGGYVNDIGSSAHEGFLGFGRVGSADYNVGQPIWNWGEAIVMEVFDPVANDGCPTSAGRSNMALTLQRTSAPIVPVGAPVSFEMQLTNTGETLLTEIALTNTFDTNLLDVVSASALSISQPAAQSVTIPQNQIALDAENGTIMLQNLDTLLPSDVLNPIQSIGLSLNFVATANNETSTRSRLSGVAAGGWGGSIAAAEVSADVQIVAPVINEIDYALFDDPNNDDAVAGSAEFIELKNSSEIDMPLGAYRILLGQLIGSEETQTVYRTINLPTQMLAPNEYFVLCTNPTLVSNCDFTIPADASVENSAGDNLIADAPIGAVALVYGETILDAVSYGGTSVGPYFEGEASTASDDTETILVGLSRFPDGADVANNLSDWSRRCATPGTANVSNDSACGPNLVVTIDANPQPVAPEAVIEYTVRYTNTGFSAARSAELFAQLSQSVTELAILSSSGPMTATIRPHGLSSTVELLPVDASGSIVLSGVVDTGLAAGTLLPAWVSLRAALPNPDNVEALSNIETAVRNVAPTAVDDIILVGEDESVLPLLLTNDTDLNGDTITITSVYTSAIFIDTGAGRPDTVGLVSLTENGNEVRYRPDLAYQYLAAGESATDFFGYLLSDGSDLTDSAIVTVTITGANDPPLANADAYTTTAVATLDAPSEFGLLSNDTDPDLSDSLSVLYFASVSQLGASVTAQPDGRFLYDPIAENPTFHALGAGQPATDTFTYTIADKLGATSAGVVNVTVVGVNDPPRANDDQFEIDEDMLLQVGAPGLLANDSDVDIGDTLSIVVSEPISPSGAILAMQIDGGLLFDPTAAPLVQALSVGESITETHVYSTQDSSGATDEARVTFFVNGVNDPPTAEDDAGVIYRQSQLVIDVLANDSDVDRNDTLSVVEVNRAGLLGEVSIEEGGLLYNPTASAQLQTLGADEFMVDSFGYILSDGNADPSTGEPTRVEATVTITVTGGNSAPLPQDDLLEMDEDNILIIDVLANDSDPDFGDAIRIESVGAAASGSISFSSGDTALTYSPIADFYGMDSFVYTIIDAGNLTATAMVTVSVLPVNDEPVFVQSAPAPDIDAGTPFSYTMRATDVDRTDPLTLTASQLPTWLQLIDNGDGSATISGTPTNADAGEQTFLLEVSDGMIIVSATISFTVLVVDNPPTATPLPSATPMPGSTPQPGETPVPDSTPVPSATSQPGETPVPVSTPVPQATPLITPETSTPPDGTNQERRLYLPLVER